MGQSKEDMQHSDYSGRPFARAKKKRTEDVRLPGGKSGGRSTASRVKEGYDALQGLIKSSAAENKAREKK